VELENAQSEPLCYGSEHPALELTGAQTEEAKNEADRRRESLAERMDNVIERWSKRMCR